MNCANSLDANSFEKASEDMLQRRMKLERATKASLTKLGALQSMLRQTVVQMQETSGLLLVSLGVNVLLRSLQEHNRQS